MTEYLIWSFEHDAWWLPNSHGYTGNIDMAGRYHAGQAAKIVLESIWLDEIAILEKIAYARGIPKFHPYNGEFNEEQDVSEIADEISIDKI